MANELAYAIEEIPDVDSVFMRAHEMHFDNGVLKPGVFRAQQGSMSVNWNKYATAQHTKQQARNPDKNAVIALIVGKVREVKDLDIKHTPDLQNRAHAEVVLPNNDEDLTEVRLLLLRVATIAIPLPQPPLN